MARLTERSAERIATALWVSAGVIGLGDASSRRLVEAQDHGRRKIERNLHDGA
jgi:hypothetical protein